MSRAKRVIAAAAIAAFAVAGVAAGTMHFHGHQPRAVAMYHHGRK